MKRIITLVVIMLAMVNVAQSQSVHISAHAHTIGNSVYVHSHCYTTGLHNHFHRTYVPRTHYSSSYYSHYNSFYTPNDWNYYDTILRDISYRREIEFGNYIFYRYDWQTSKSTVYFKAKINRKDKVNFMANIESYKDTLKNKYYDIKNIEVVTKKNKSHVNLVITYISSEEKAIIKNNIRKNWEAKQRQSWKEKYQEKHKNELTIAEKNNQNLKQENKVKIDSAAMGQKTSKQIDNMFYSCSYSKDAVRIMAEMKAKNPEMTREKKDEMYKRITVKKYGNSGRARFDVGDYTLTRKFYYTGRSIENYDVETCNGIQEYYIQCQETEGKALKEHFERNRQYYNDKYGFTILDITYSNCKFTLEVFFPDWAKLQKEAKAKEKAKEQKRLESINW